MWPRYRHESTGASCTDLYAARMAASYLRRGMTAPATFSLFVRNLPLDRGYLVATRLRVCLELLADFAFETDDLTCLREEAGFTMSDLDALARVRFTGDVRAVPEGTVLAREPILEVTAPLPEAPLVETMLLNQVTFARPLQARRHDADSRRQRPRWWTSPHDVLRVWMPL